MGAIIAVPVIATLQMIVLREMLRLRRQQLAIVHRGLDKR